ncbi:hypothetical protein DSO57_1015251 [Entomophthora muscae]|uniref:Uncharacterized protein n=1 Tax=Entomophthora muscae TaxID=34485 RepID=A0ACC2T569_9FUNG|nr:hypothetical protein DSO57_1015251 [Entomophthora muscae]
MASWWILPPGWEPNLVILAPLSHKEDNVEDKLDDEEEDKDKEEDGKESKNC